MPHFLKTMHSLTNKHKISILNHCIDNGHQLRKQEDVWQCTSCEWATQVGYSQEDFDKLAEAEYSGPNNFLSEIELIKEANFIRFNPDEPTLELLT